MTVLAIVSILKSFPNGSLSFHTSAALLLVECCLVRQRHSANEGIVGIIVTVSVVIFDLMPMPLSKRCRLLFHRIIFRWQRPVTSRLICFLRKRETEVSFILSSYSASQSSSSSSFSFVFAVSFFQIQSRNGNRSEFKYTYLRRKAAR